MPDADLPQLWAILPYEETRPTFALPLFRFQGRESINFIQEVDEYLRVISGFRTFIDDASDAHPIEPAPLTKLGDSPVHGFVTQDGTAHAGNLFQLRPLLSSMLNESNYDIGLSLQIAELIGTDQQKRKFRTEMRDFIIKRGGRESAVSLYEHSALLTTIWDGLLSAATNQQQAKEILAVRASIAFNVGDSGTVHIDPRSVGGISLDQLQQIQKIAEGELMVDASELPRRLGATPPVGMAVILTALEIETRSVLRHMTDVREETTDDAVFHVGRFEAWEIALAEVGQGNVIASTIANQAVRQYKAQVALFVGVAGGIKDVRIGDIVVGDKLYSYESGKEATDGFLPRPDVHRGSFSLEQRARAIRQSERWKSRLDTTIGHQDPRIFVGAIAAGEKVLASNRGVVIDFVRRRYSDALAVEMEGGGFLAGVSLSSSVKGGVIRGISDTLRGKARADMSGSQIKAADAASAVAFEILSNLKPK